jgi:starch phosphorylase
MPALPTRDYPAGLGALGELALDLRWTWNHGADALWERVDAEAWSRTRNPWIILQDISAERLQALAADASFVAELERLAGTRRAYLDAPSWFSSAMAPLLLQVWLISAWSSGSARDCRSMPEGSAS